MKYSHFSIEEREQIQELLWQGWSIRAIAHHLSRAPSSLSRELKKNCPKIRTYTPRLAEERAKKKRLSRGRTERLKNERIRTYVVAHLKEGWSPEQIAGRMRIDLKESISHEAIYQYIYHQVYRNGWGELKLGREDLRVYLRRKQKRRQKRGSRKGQRVLKHLGASIDLRPAIVGTRARFGDWEGDTVESKDHAPGINTLVERKSGYLMMTKLSAKNGVATKQAVSQRMQTLPSILKHTLTLDNGKENLDWQSLQAMTGLTIYYAHPYHSWERGTNENTNGLIREYFPKKTDFRIIPAEILATVEHILNTRPRKRLKWLTPLEVIGVALES